MFFTPKKIALLVLAVTSVVCSKALFFFFDDPEGPNLLIVTVMAATLYLISLAVYACNFSQRKKLLLGVGVQIVLTTVLYVFLH